MEQLTAKALLVLCGGWQRGMVDNQGAPATCSTWWPHRLPLLSSPSNWGCWEHWVSMQGLTVEISPYLSRDQEITGWLLTLDGHATSKARTKAEALLGSLYVGWARFFGSKEKPADLQKWWDSHLNRKVLEDGSVWLEEDPE